jgi:hypothetical protein
MADRLLGLVMLSTDPDISQAGVRMFKCATNETGWRCEHALCPRCQRRIALRRRRELQRELRAAPPGVRIAHITLSLGADDIADGRALLISAFALLRRHHCWTTGIFGGHAQIEVLPSIGGSRGWNVHLHALAYLKPARLDVRAVRVAWLLLLSGLPGSVKYEAASRKFVPAKEGGGSFQQTCFYVSKRMRAKDWLGCTDTQLLALVQAVPRKRWVIPFGRRPGHGARGS